MGDGKRGSAFDRFVLPPHLLWNIELQIHLLLAGGDAARANSHRARLLGLNKTARRTGLEGGKEAIGGLPDRRTDCADRSTLIRTLAPRVPRSTLRREGAFQLDYFLALTESIRQQSRAAGQVADSEMGAAGAGAEIAAYPPSIG
jgi:hypothetical protein